MDGVWRSEGTPEEPFALIEIAPYISVHAGGFSLVFAARGEEPSTLMV
jgi:hypothetical protein